MKRIVNWVGGLAVVAAVLVMSGSVQAETIVNVVDLGTLGGTESHAYGLNTLGDVTGSYLSGGLERAFVWHDTNGNKQVDAGEMVDLGTLGGTQSCGYAINDSGQVTGWAYKTGKTNQVAFIWTDANHNWQSNTGEMASIGTLGGTTSRGYAINNAGIVTGLSYLADESKRAFRWVDGDGDWKYDAGETANLGTLGGNQSRAYGINNAGNVAGYAADASAVQSFRWVDTDGNGAVSPGEMEALTSIALPSFAMDVDENGNVVGYFTTGGVNHAYYYDNDGMHDLNGLLGGTWSEAYSINNSGLVCGSYGIGGQTHAFVYDSETNTVQDLNDLLPEGSGWLLETARDIEGDMVVGWGRIDGEKHAFLAMATESEAGVPEPMTLVLLSSGAVMLLRRKRS